MEPKGNSRSEEGSEGAGPPAPPGQWPGLRRLWGRGRRAALEALGRPTFDAFAGVEPNPRRQAQILRHPAPERSYALIFTPRTGSSRLQEILRCAGNLGDPGELFNPQLMAPAVRNLGAGDIESYVELLRRARARGGTFGVEATWHHIQANFGNGRRFRDLLRPDAWIWLLREDIVLQAVSISRMVQTRIDHALPSVDGERLAAAERAFAYDGADIRARLLAMARLERRSEAMFRALGVRPLRLSYERTIGEEPERLARRIGAHLGVPWDAGARFESVHSKLGTDKNLRFAERFRAENPRLLARIERARAPRLAALDG